MSIGLTLWPSLLLLVSFEKEVHDIKVEATGQAFFVLKHEVADGVHCRLGVFPTGYDTLILKKRLQFYFGYRNVTDFCFAIFM